MISANANIFLFIAVLFSVWFLANKGRRLDIVFWLIDESLEDSEHLPDPDVIARDIAENLESALEQFSSIREDLKKPVST